MGTRLIKMGSSLEGPLNFGTVLLMLSIAKLASVQPSLRKVCAHTLLSIYTFRRTGLDTNYGYQGVRSNVFYDHFSLLKTIEGGFGLPCLNHACDANVRVMSDLFAAKQ